jgi:hypothetical protein
MNFGKTLVYCVYLASLMSELYQEMDCQIVQIFIIILCYLHNIQCGLIIVSLSMAAVTGT